MRDIVEVMMINIMERREMIIEREILENRNKIIFKITEIHRKE